MDSSFNQIAKNHRCKPIILVLIALQSLVVLSLVQTQHSKNVQTYVESICSATLHPQLCLSTLTPVSITARNDVVTPLLIQTRETVQQNDAMVKKIIASQNFLSEWEITALHICSELSDLTLEYLQVVEAELKHCRLENNSASDHLANLINYLSAAQTNQDTCIDEFSLDNKPIRLTSTSERVILAHKLSFRLMSNLLAVIKNLSNSRNGETLSSFSTSSSSFPWSVIGEWPEWLSVADRRLLQVPEVDPNVTVAADGSGDYTTISAALAAAPNRSSRRYVIRIRAGIYQENVDIPSRLRNLMFVGDGRQHTIITGNRSVALTPVIHTYNTSTVGVKGYGFMARDITFQNTAGPKGHQAVALNVQANRSAFYRCSMIGYQDTLYAHTFHQFYTDCYITGTVDFIFGNAAAVFQNCDIRPRRPNKHQHNMITAQARSDPNMDTGIVIQRCRINATSDLLPVQSRFDSYLGRPWKKYSRTIIMETQISNVIHPAGWRKWKGEFALDTLFFAEYKNTGAGSHTLQRVNWTGYRVFTSDAEAWPFTAEKFIKAGSWLPATNFPYSLGL